jgi:ribosomal protein S18 acetylase RimI-like enzyme
MDALDVTVSAEPLTTIRRAEPLDAGRLGDILWGFQERSSWLPALHSQVEALRFCGALIDEGVVRVAAAAEDIAVAEVGESTAGTHNFGKTSGGTYGGTYGGTSGIFSGGLTLHMRQQARLRIAGFIARRGEDVLALYVSRAHQRQGIGSALIREAQENCSGLTLWTFQANLPAQRFYRSLGFVETARSDGKENDEQLPDIHYKWKR